MSQFYLVAPSGYCINQQAAARGVERLQQAGHEVAHQQVIPRRQQRFAGTEQERLADINQSGLLATGNVITFSGPMLAGNFGAETLDPFTEHHFWQALRQAEFTLEWPGEGPNCQVEGTLWGGNLAMLTSLIGTPWLPAIRDGILVVEDINEHPFRVERMLLQLLHSGVLAAQKAVIFGSFTGSAPNDYDAGYDLPQVFDYLRQQLSLPLISGLEFGHEQRTVTLPLGARARLVNQAATTTLTISGHPVLTE